MHPFLFEFWGLKIFSYPLFVGMAWGLGYKICCNNNLLMEKGSFQGLFWGTFITSWLGAKIFFLLASEVHAFQYYSRMPSFWLGGGFVFYGGLALGIFYVFIYSYVLKKFPVERLGWVLPALGWGHALGRTGCFLSGCCYGKITQVPWSIYLHGHFRHPVPLYEAGFLVLLAIVSHRLLKRGASSLSVAGFYFVMYALGRLLLEFFRGDTIRGIYWWGGSFSQVISALLIVLILSIFFLHRLSKEDLR